MSSNLPTSLDCTGGSEGIATVVGGCGLTGGGEESFVFFCEAGSMICGYLCCS